jgi:thiamine biosynthesis protein ThiS
MLITVNSGRRTLPEGTRLLTLLEMLGLTPAATVVERNGSLMDRTQYAEITLAEGDILELVRFVGGG